MMPGSTIHATWIEAARLAFESLRSSMLRSILTLIGIILSTTTLIAVMAIIHGMDVYVAESASTMGNDGFRVLRVAFTGLQNPRKFFEAQQKNPQLTRDEYEFIKPRLKLVREVGISGTRSARVSYESDAVAGVGLQGVTSNAAAMSNTQIAMGRFLTDAEDQRRMAVVFLGSDLKERFFPSMDPIGKIVKIDGIPFEVIGVGQSKGSLFGQSQDNYVSIPVNTYFKIYGDRVGIGYNFQAIGRDYLEQCADEVRAMMRAYRHLRPNQDDNFAVVSSDSMVGLWDQLTGAISAVAVAVVTVFMVVGGVVIMNIMLAVVSERTHEIGLRKSVGARRRDIMSQFLFESSILAGAGGLIGILVAWIAAVVVRNMTPVPMEVPVYSVLIGVGLSTIVGLFFGIYPARKAAELDPIAALRAEK
jgi:putative ABC transport system permease protein